MTVKLQPHRSETYEGATTEAFRGTREQCLKAAKAMRSRTHFYVRVWGDAPIADEPDRCFRAAICLGVPVTKRSMLILIGKAMSDSLQDRKAQLTWSVYTSADKTYVAFYLLGE